MEEVAQVTPHPMVELHQKLTEHVLKAKISQKKWERLLEFPDKDFIYNNLKILESTHWAEIVRIKTQFCATPEMWENMELMFDEVEFQEVAALRAAQKKLREWWAEFKEALIANVKQSKAG